MDHQEKRRQILDQMAQIECMEKGRLSEEYRERQKDGEMVRLGPYYKHQCWEDGRNASRRVPAAEVERLREGVDGYHRFRELADEFVEVTVDMTRESAADEGKKSPDDLCGDVGRNRSLRILGTTAVLARRRLGHGGLGARAARGLVQRRLQDPGGAA